MSSDQNRKEQKKTSNVNVTKPNYDVTLLRVVASYLECRQAASPL